MKRGEIWIGSGGTYSRKPRPVLIIQDDIYATELSVVVLPLTTVLRDVNLTRYRLTPHPDNGLLQESDVQIDKITALRRDQLSARSGRVDARSLIEIERLLILFLGIGR